MQLRGIPHIASIEAIWFIIQLFNHGLSFDTIIRLSHIGQ